MSVLKNSKHERFIQNIVKGMSQREAYKKAFKVNYDDDAIDCNASKLFNTAKVQQRYKELLEKLEEATIMSAKDRMIWLSKVVSGEVKEESKYFEDHEAIIYEKEADITTKIKAIDTLNKMSGEYIEKLKVSGDAEEPFEVNIKVVK